MPSAEDELLRASRSRPPRPGEQVDSTSPGTTSLSAGCSSLPAPSAPAAAFSSFSSPWEETRYWATRALEAKAVDPRELPGQGADRREGGDACGGSWKRGGEPTRFVEAAAEHITALLLVRLAAIENERHCDEICGGDDSEGSRSSGHGHCCFTDLSTATICRQTLHSSQPWRFLENPRSKGDAGEGGAASLVARQARRLVSAILATYNTSLPFHNARHAYRAVLAVRDLLDRMLCVPGTQKERSYRLPPLFGLRRDAAAQLSLVFAALIHDAGHLGVTNSQLAREGHAWALLYNDESIQEQHSLSVAFRLLLSDEYADLRDCMFLSGGAVRTEESRPNRDSERLCDANFRCFRTLVINAVLGTDLSNPGRAQIVRSKYREAFADSSPPITAESGHSRRPSLRADGTATARRGSMMSDISMPRIPSGRNVHHPMPIMGLLGGGSHHRPHRRGSNLSVSSNLSDVTTDSVARMMTGMAMAKATSGQAAQNSLSASRRSSIASDYDSVQYMQRHRHCPLLQADGMERANEPTRRTVVPGQRRLSNDFSVETSGSTEYGKDSIAMVQQKKGAMKERQSGGRGEGAKSSGAGFTSTAAPVLGTGLHRNSQDRSRVSRRWSTTMTDQTDPVLGSLPSGMPPVQYREYYSYNNNDDYYNDTDDDSQEDSCSLSLTPPSSDDEVDGVVITGLTISGNSSGKLPIGGAIILARKKKCDGSNFPPTHPSSPWSSAVASRRASTGMTPAVGHVTSGCTKSNESLLEDKEDLWSRRFSSNSHHDASGAHKKRLSIRRSMDLSGEPIERFSTSFSHRGGGFGRRDSLGAMSLLSFESREGDVFSDQRNTNHYEPDDLKVEVIVELLLRVADVYHYFLDFGDMTRATSDLFRELLGAHRNGRGTDPRLTGWFDSQIRVMDYYLMPLARQLEDTGVLSSQLCTSAAVDAPGLTAGAIMPHSNVSFSLVDLLKVNQERWMREGFDVVDALLEETSDG